MPPQIPGYYYDDTRGKYFRITNGLTQGSGAQYHNNAVQQQRRVETHKKKEARARSLHHARHRQMLAERDRRSSVYFTAKHQRNFGESFLSRMLGLVPDEIPPRFRAISVPAAHPHPIGIHNVAVDFIHCQPHVIVKDHELLRAYHVDDFDARAVLLIHTLPFHDRDTTMWLSHGYSVVEGAHSYVIDWHSTGPLRGHLFNEKVVVGPLSIGTVQGRRFTLHRHNITLRHEPRCVHLVDVEGITAVVSTHSSKLHIDTPNKHVELAVGGAIADFLVHAEYEDLQAGTFKVITLSKPPRIITICHERGTFVAKWTRQFTYTNFNFAKPNPLIVDHYLFVRRLHHEYQLTNLYTLETHVGSLSVRLGFVVERIWSGFDHERSELYVLSSGDDGLCIDVIEM